MWAESFHPAQTAQLSSELPSCWAMCAGAALLTPPHHQHIPAQCRRQMEHQTQARGAHSSCFEAPALLTTVFEAAR